MSSRCFPVTVHAVQESETAVPPQERVGEGRLLGGGAGRLGAGLAVRPRCRSCGSVGAPLLREGSFRSNITPSRVGKGTLA